MVNKYASIWLASRKHDRAGVKYGLMGAVMSTITIDGIQYETESLSEIAQAQIASLQFVQGEIARLEAQIAVYRTAETGYAKALKDELSCIDP